MQNELSSSGWPRKCVPAPFSFPSPVPPLSANRSWRSASRGSVLLWVPVGLNVCMSLAKGEKKNLVYKKKVFTICLFFPPSSLSLSFSPSLLAVEWKVRKRFNGQSVGGATNPCQRKFDSSRPDSGQPTGWGKAVRYVFDAEMEAIWEEEGTQTSE